MALILSATPSPNYIFKFKVNHNKIEKGVFCNIRIAGIEKRAKVIITGGLGWLWPRQYLQQFAKNFPKEYVNVVASGYEQSADFAILQIEGLSNNSCIPLSQNSLQPGEPTHAVSYTCVSRPNFTARNNIPLYTSGVRTSGFQDSFAFKQRQNNLGIDLDIYNVDGSFFSSLDAESCSSGSALLNERNQVVGVMSRVIKTNDSGDFEYGSLLSVDLNRITGDLSLKLSRDQIEEVTRCSQN